MAVAVANAGAGYIPTALRICAVDLLYHIISLHLQAAQVSRKKPQHNSNQQRNH